MARSQTKPYLLLTFLLITWIGFRPALAADYKTYQENIRHINWMGDFAVIAFAHQNYLHSSYVVLDKGRQALFQFNQDSEDSYDKVLTQTGDEIDKGGAGIYTYQGQKEGRHFGIAESDHSSHFLFEGDLQIKPGTPIYVLSEKPLHRFRIRNYKLTFNSLRVQRNRPGFNYSPVDTTFYTSLYTTDFTDGFTQTFLKTLQDEKQKLMQILDLENDEYNMLAQFAFGVLSVETNYGKDIKYKIKNRIPYLVSLAKGNGFDTTFNSRGPTQIKIIPESVEAVYGLNKSNLADPRNAAVATLAFGAQTLIELRNYSNNFSPITEETLHDYLYYLYNGKRFEIKNQSAKPDQNLAIQKIRKAITHFQIEESPPPSTK